MPSPERGSREGTAAVPEACYFCPKRWVVYVRWSGTRHHSFICTDHFNVHKHLVAKVWEGDQAVAYFQAKMAAIEARHARSDAQP